MLDESPTLNVSELVAKKSEDAVVFVFDPGENHPIESNAKPRIIFFI